MIIKHGGTTYHRHLNINNHTKKTSHSRKEEITIGLKNNGNFINDLVVL